MLDNNIAPIANEGDTVESNAVDRGTSSGIISSSGLPDDDNGSFLTNKIKLAENEYSTNQSYKRSKQDYSDITGDTEPFDFTDGEDS